jgi:hypothetical protein
LIKQHEWELQKAYNLEPRDLLWAPEMEKTLLRFFEPDLLEKLDLRGLSNIDVECRTRICRLQVDFPQETYRRPSHRPPSRRVFTALTSIVYYAGPMADRIADTVRPLPNAAQPTIRLTALLPYDADRRDPSLFNRRPVEQIKLEETPTMEPPR